MHQESTSSPAATSSDVQTVAESEVGGEVLTAQTGFGFPVDSSFLDGSALTRSKVATLQRIIGNQATQRVIQRELASRKAKNVIQRATVTDKEETDITQVRPRPRASGPIRKRIKKKLIACREFPA